MVLFHFRTITPASIYGEKWVREVVLEAENFRESVTTWKGSKSWKDRTTSRSELSHAFAYPWVNPFAPWAEPNSAVVPGIPSRKFRSDHLYPSNTEYLRDKIPLIREFWILQDPSILLRRGIPVELHLTKYSGQRRSLWPVWSDALIASQERKALFTLNKSFS